MLRIISKRKIWYTISGVLIAGSILCLILFGLNLGIDYIGGSLWDIKTDTRIQVSEVREFLSNYVIGKAIVQPTDDGLLMRFKEIDDEAHQKIYQDFIDKFGAIEEKRFESIGSVIGKELKQKSTGSIILVSLAIILYIAWAFRKVSKPINSWKYGILTVVALLHDIILPLGLFAVLGKFLNVEIGAPFIAAILTIAGYSVNDTIVVFDRVRENLIKEGDGNFENIIEKSVNQTMARSINTTLTTLLALAAVYFFGGETIKYFALALIVGIASGAYSSIFIASPLLVTWYKRQYK